MKLIKKLHNSFLKFKIHITSLNRFNFQIFPPQIYALLPAGLPASARSKCKYRENSNGPDTFACRKRLCSYVKSMDDIHFRLCCVTSVLKYHRSLFWNKVQFSVSCRGGSPLIISGICSVRLHWRGNTRESSFASTWRTVIIMTIFFY